MRRAVRWATVVAALAAAVPARAEDTARRDAEARFEEGLARVRAHDLEAALQSFRQASALMRKPEIVWNLALTEEKTNHPVDALAHFKEYVRLAPATDPDLPRAQKHIDALNAAAGHIAVTAPTGAAITVDGAQAGPAPLADAVDVTPGHHDVEARLGTIVKTVAIEALPGQTMQADFRGMDAPAGGGAAPGATAPQPNGAPPAGETPGADHPQTSATFFTPRVITAASLAGLAVVSLGTAVGFGVAANSNATSVNGFVSQHGSSYCTANAASSTCATWKSDASAQNTDTTLSIAFYIASGVLAAGSVATYLLWPGEPKAASNNASKNMSMWLVPTVSPSGLGLGAAGRF